jgi:biotin carboxylase
MNRKWLVILDITSSTLDYFKAARNIGISTLFITAPLNEVPFSESLWLRAQNEADKVIITPVGKLLPKILEFLNQYHGDEIIGGVTPEEYRHIELEELHRFLKLSHLYQEKLNVILDKYKVRQELEKNGFSEIQSFLAPSRNNLDYWLSRFTRYPCVLKPNHGNGSLFVKVAKNSNDLRLALLESYSIAEDSMYTRILGEKVPFFIEDYILGDMFSFEGLMINGYLCSWGVAKRFRYPHDETIEMGSTYPCYIDKEEKWRKQIEDWLLTLKWKNGGVHFEGILTPTGQIEMIELGASHLIRR